MIFSFLFYGAIYLLFGAVMYIILADPKDSFGMALFAITWPIVFVFGIVIFIVNFIKTVYEELRKR